MNEFDEWFKNRHTRTGLYEEALCGKDDATYIRHEMRKAYLTGAQSKQAKIDELKQSIVMQDLFYDQSAEIKNLKLKIDELQKHSLMLREAAKSWSYNEGEKNILISQADDLDRILKGNKDD